MRQHAGRKDEFLEIERNELGMGQKPLPESEVAIHSTNIRKRDKYLTNLLKDYILYKVIYL